MPSSKVAACMASLSADVAHMSEQNQEHFVDMLTQLAKLYRDDAKAKGVLLLANDEYSTIIHINADEFEAYGLVADAMPKHCELLLRDAPERGELN